MVLRWSARGAILGSGSRGLAWRGRGPKTGVGYSFKVPTTRKRTFKPSKRTTTS